MKSKIIERVIKIHRALAHYVQTHEYLAVDTLQALKYFCLHNRPNTSMGWVADFFVGIGDGFFISYYFFIWYAL